ncbi:MAG: DUF2851 family protein [Bacteroidia bacterium]|nr:DUF2851 family protein [Bacteroidia bacterium]
MNEQLLQYIWQFTHFDVKSLSTSHHLPLSIYSVGKPNSDAGPDFLNARINIDGLDWYGDIEIHINSSDWLKHKHHNDKRYNSVILHVVWKNDKEIRNSNGELIPCLELEPIVDINLLSFYKKLMQSQSWILCQPYFKKADKFIVSQFTNRLLIERLEYKSNTLLDRLNELNNDWDSLFYESLCHSIGLKINAEPMLSLSKKLPFSILSKHRNNLFQIESLLFGVAGFLSDVNDDYGLSLRKEFSFLKSKYELEELDVNLWMFMRLRPSSFPTIRIAQLAQLIVNNDRLFSLVIEADTLADLRKIIKANVSEYWLTHYHFKKASLKRKKTLGQHLFDTIIINTICPLLFVYSKQKANEAFQEKSIRFLEEIQAEKNNVVEGFRTIGLDVSNAAHSQALLQLKRNYCEAKKCLNCNIGNDLITKNEKSS